MNRVEYIKVMNRVEWLDATAKAVYDFLEVNTVGGCLHVVLGDENIDDDDVELGLQHAKDEGDSRAIAIAEAMLEMTECERGYVITKAAITGEGAAERYKMGYSLFRR